MDIIVDIFGFIFEELPRRVGLKLKARPVGELDDMMARQHRYRCQACADDTPCHGGVAILQRGIDEQNDDLSFIHRQRAALERALDEENKRPLPNQDAIYDLKRQKLRIKDEIYQIEKH